MARYCITAANHTNPDNHVASLFQLWSWNDSADKWMLHPRPATARHVVELIENGHEVITARYNEEASMIVPGARVEVELRIEKNGGVFPISEMPEFEA